MATMATPEAENKKSAGEPRFFIWNGKLQTRKAMPARLAVKIGELAVS
jgi:hypothetical protein